MISCSWWKHGISRYPYRQWSLSIDSFRQTWNVVLSIFHGPYIYKIVFLWCTIIHSRHPASESCRVYPRSTRWFSISGVASPKFWEGKKILGPKMFDLSRATAFCLGRHFSNHKMTRYDKNLEGPWPLGPSWLHLCFQ